MLGSDVTGPTYFHYYYYYYYKSKDLSGTITSQTLQGHFTKLRKEKNVCEAQVVQIVHVIVRLTVTAKEKYFNSNSHYGYFCILSVYYF